MVTVRTETEFKNAVTNSEDEIIVAGNIALNSPTTIAYTVLIRGEQDTSLLWIGPTAANPNMLIVANAGNLTIESLTLDAENRDGTLVQINGGIFTMNEGSMLRNVRSTTSNSAVRIAGITSLSGGSFTMNGGLITGIDSSDAVLNCGGTVIMNNSAAISSNRSAGISMLMPISGSVRPSLIMSGQSVISENTSKQAGGAGILLESDVIMGLNPGDAPLVKNNSAPDYCGGWYIIEESVLTMRYDSEISGNFAPDFIGGLLLNDTVLTMLDNASIKENRTNGLAGGVFVNDAVVILEGNASISDNEAGESGGGLFLQNNSVMELKGNSKVCRNTGENGGGVFLTGSKLIAGDDTGIPSIFENTARGLGGGIFISESGSAELKGNMKIYGNEAVQGAGIYKNGELLISGSPLISDGLFFDCEPLPGIMQERRFGPVPHIYEVSEGVYRQHQIALEQLTVERVPAERHSAMRQTVVTAAPVHCNNMPVIDGALTDDAAIQLEKSDYVSPQNVQLAIAAKGENYVQLEETDSSAWLIPGEFGEGHKVVLNEELDHVLIIHETYNIRYFGLRGAVNPNPQSYDLSDLPITLLEPGERPGYEFKGWYDLNGEQIFEIPLGTTGQLIFTAVWEELEKHCISFKANGRCVKKLPDDICALPGETVTIPFEIPTRKYCCFKGWNTMQNGKGTAYAPYDTMEMGNEDVELYAQWRRLCNCRDISCIRRAGVIMYCPDEVN